MREMLMIIFTLSLFSGIVYCLYQILAALEQRVFKRAGKKRKKKLYIGFGIVLVSLIGGLSAVDENDASVQTTSKAESEIETISSEKRQAAEEAIKDTEEKLTEKLKKQETQKQETQKQQIQKEEKKTNKGALQKLVDNYLEEPSDEIQMDINKYEASVIQSVFQDKAKEYANLEINNVNTEQLKVFSNLYTNCVNRDIGKKINMEADNIESQISKAKSIEKQHSSELNKIYNDMEQVSSMSFYLINKLETKYEDTFLGKLQKNLDSLQAEDVKQYFARDVDLDGLPGDAYYVVESKEAFGKSGVINLEVMNTGETIPLVDEKGFENDAQLFVCVSKDERLEVFQSMHLYQKCIIDAKESLMNIYGFVSDKAITSMGSNSDRPDIFGGWNDEYSQRCYAEITDSNGIYQIELNWSSSANENTRWVMSGYFEDQLQAVIYSDCIKYEENYSNGNGDPVIREEYTKGTGRFYMIGELLYWDDDKEDIGKETVFKRY